MDNVRRRVSRLGTLGVLARCFDLYSSCHDALKSPATMSQGMVKSRHLAFTTLRAQLCHSFYAKTLDGAGLGA